MHKKIALLIEKMINESPYNHFHCDVVPNETGGFWKIYINFDKRDDAHSAALFESLHHIGMVYGEGLGIEDKGDIVIVS